AMSLVDPDLAECLDSLFTEFVALRDPENSRLLGAGEPPLDKRLDGCSSLSGTRWQGKDPSVAARRSSKHVKELRLEISLEVFDVGQRPEWLDIDAVRVGRRSGYAAKDLR